MGVVYTMANKDTNANYQEVVRVADQYGEIIKLTIRIFFFFEIGIHYFLYREFSGSS